MAWPETIETDWKSFISNVARYTVGSPSAVSYIWRGQSDSRWSLNPSLLRLLDKNTTPEKAVIIEQAMVARFLSEAHLHSEINAEHCNDYLKCLTIMQHHNAPTRLLDWTLSPFVAAYFAVESNWDKDGAVYFVHVQDFIEHVSDTYVAFEAFPLATLLSQCVDPLAPMDVLPILPEKKSTRMVAQQGVFTMSLQILCDHAAALDDVCKNIQGTKGGDTYRKVIIPKEKKPEFLRMLKSMNISASSLFPGVDGLGRSIAELIRLDSHYPLLNNDITTPLHPTSG